MRLEMHLTRLFAFRRFYCICAIRAVETTTIRCYDDFLPAFHLSIWPSLFFLYISFSCSIRAGSNSGGFECTQTMLQVGTSWTHVTIAKSYQPISLACFCSPAFYEMFKHKIEHKSTPNLIAFLKYWKSIIPLNDTLQPFDLICWRKNWISANKSQTVLALFKNVSFGFWRSESVCVFFLVFSSIRKKSGQKCAT